MSTTKKTTFGCLGIIALLIVLMVASGSFYTINERQQAIVTQFGKPIGEPVVEAGLKFKIPFVQKVNIIEKRILEWDGLANEMPTRDKTYILVDTFGRWQIDQPRVFFERLRDERSAISRLNDILGSETRNTIAKHDLIEAVRTTKDREALQSEELVEADRTGKVGVLKSIRHGRTKLEEEILSKAAPKLSEFGIKLLDIRFKRINYNPSVQQRIFERMISERKQIAERFRSEGAGEAAKIQGNMEKELREIESGAYRTVETTKGEADAEATKIYADAYGQTAQSAEFYDFTRTLDVYQSVLGKDSTLIMTTDSELFRLLKTTEAKASSTAP
ncbi:protease modulator HflC [Haloferula sp.]|uniref:protease modulator HflC n=1 Tax=Haloferula sp. TaxID=2497595 RepID=UPI003C76DF19